MSEHISLKLEDTENIAKDIAKNLNPGDILLLQGNLGAGKTTLTKMIATELGVKDDVTSPTFGLMNLYPISESLQLVHIDTYRLEDEQALVDIGVEDYLGDSETICIIEWPEKIEGLLEDKKVKLVEITIGEENSRKIIIGE